MKKTVLITGASRGIGREIARKFAENNFNVAINYNNSEKEALAIFYELKEINKDIILIKSDVSNKNDVVKMVTKTVEEFGSIDILVNNAGISEVEFFTDITEGSLNKIFDINVKGVFYCSQEVSKIMIANKSGKIINISSIWGNVGASMEVHYSATKGAVNAFTKALAKELGPSNITVNAVAPGLIQTDMLDEISEDDIEYARKETPLGRVGTPREVAETVYFLASEKGDFFTGQILTIDGGFAI